MNNFKKLAVASAVSAAIGFAGAVQADSVLFPFINTTASAFTFVTVVNDAVRDSNDEYSHGAVALHFYYGYKPVDSKPSDSCIHKDYTLSVTENAILQLEVSKKLDLITEFNDVSSYGVGMVPLPVGNYGFLSVETGGAGSDPSLFGEGVVIDTATGLNTAYSAIKSTADSNPDWTTAAPNTNDYVTSWYPSSVVTTTWYALALGPRSSMTPNNNGGVTLWLRPETDTAGSPTPGNYGAFYRDGIGHNELYVSGTNYKRVVCWGTFTLDDLLNDSAAVADGGWMSVAGYPGTSTTPNFTSTQNYLLWKIQNTTALGAPLDLISLQTPRN